MDFEKAKKVCMEKLRNHDNSKKGHVDEQIIPIIEHVNNKKDYYTTSSCAGRISLIKIPSTGKKHEAEWLFVSHEPIVDFKRPEKLPYEQVLFRMEPAILHVCCRNLDVANVILSAAHEAGFKHSGIISLQKRIMVEINGSDRVDTIAADQGVWLLNDDYMRLLIRSSNKKLKNTRQRLSKFMALI